MVVVDTEWSGAEAERQWKEDITGMGMQVLKQDGRGQP